MENKQESFQTAQQSSGSAEDKGEARTAQQNNNAVLSDEEKQNLAAQLGEGPNAVVGLKDLGAVSGRDDASGSSGDGMESQSTGQHTDR